MCTQNNGTYEVWIYYEMIMNFKELIIPIISCDSRISTCEVNLVLQEVCHPSLPCERTSSL